MLVAGCGCPVVLSFSSSSTATVLLASEGELTRRETISGISYHHILNTSLPLRGGSM